MAMKVDDDYVRVTERGLREAEPESQAGAGLRLADTPPADNPPPSAVRQAAAGPRLADPPPAVEPLTAAQKAGNVQVQAGPGPRLADTPAADKPPPAANPPPPAEPFTASQKARNVQDFSGAVFLFGAAGKLYSPAFDIQTFKAYLDSYIKDAGAPTDPVERMLLEQLVLAHFSIGRLHFRAGTRDGLEEVTACAVAAARLQAEFRRSALALQAYRERRRAARSSRTPTPGSPPGPRDRRAAGTALR
jgi:hypothetical protein